MVWLVGIQQILRGWSLRRVFWLCLVREAGVFGYVRLGVVGGGVEGRELKWCSIPIIVTLVENMQ